VPPEAPHSGSALATSDRLTSNVRIFFVGGYIAYRALFGWMRPSMYIPTMLGTPLFQILFFAYVGRTVGLEDDSFFVVGNLVQVSAMAGIFGMAMTIGGERWTQTLPALLATPSSRIALFLGRALPLIVNGVITAAFGFIVGRLLLDFHPAPSTLPGLAAVVLVCAGACTAFGLVIGAIGLRARDVFFLANTVYFLMLLFCGVNVPLDALPGWMQQISQALPLTHGIQAAREVASGASLGDVGGLVAKEAALGVIYAAVAYGLFRFFEADGRRRASLETM
jgi:ABC-2 type transport system permease protein